MKPASKPAIAYSYLRFSRPEQAAGDSLRRQTEGRDGWLRSNPHVALDTVLKLTDLGVGAFRGVHRSDKHCLGQFLALVEKKEIKPGSYLLIENLDRLSREDVEEGLWLLLGLIRVGVVVVQLSPLVTEFRKGSEDLSMKLMMAIMELRRGNSESAMKSERCGNAWADKKRRAAIDKKPITRIVPSWLEVVGDKFVVREDAARTVRRVFQLAREGVGIKAIVKTLTSDGTPTITGVRGRNRGKHWSITFVKQVLNMAQTYGVYQPMRGKNSRTIDGDPIPGYFPAIITEAEFMTTRAALATRRTARGRPTRGDVNVFKNLLHDAVTRSSLCYMSKQGRPAVYYPQAWRRGECSFSSFPVRILEAAIFSAFSEIDPKSILPNPAGDVSEAERLEGEVDSVKSRIALAKARMTGEAGDEEDFGQLADVLKELGRQLRVKSDRLAELRRDGASPASAAWGECQSIITVLDAAPDREAARLKLRQLIKRIVSEIWVCVRRSGHCRQVDVLIDVYFTGGHCRTYMTKWVPPTARTPEKWACLPFDRPPGQDYMRDNPNVVKFWLDPPDPEQIRR